MIIGRENEYSNQESDTSTCEKLTLASTAYDIDEPQELMRGRKRKHCDQLQESEPEKENITATDKYLEQVRDGRDRKLKKKRT